MALIRHYDVTGKLCPKYYVEHIDAWKAFKNDVTASLGGTVTTTSTSSAKDDDLLVAINALVKAGVNLDPSVWGNVNTMNLKYAQTMVERIGTFFGKSGYENTVEFLVQKGCIGTRDVWDKKNFKAEWCKALIIKVYEKLVK